MQKLVRGLGALVLVLASCQSPLGPKGSAPGTAAGTVSIAFASASRTVVADWNAAITSYQVTLTSQDGYATRETTATPGSSASFTGVTAGTWDVGVSALNGATVVGAGSLSGQVLTSGASLSLTVPVAGTQTGTGGFSFRFTVPSSTYVRYVSAQLYHPTTGAAVGNPIVPTLSASGSHHQGTVERTGVASGAYRLGLTLHWGPFADSTVAATVSEAINVWDNVTSDQWLDSSGQLNAQRAFSADEFRFGHAGEVSTLAIAGNEAGFNYPYGMVTDGTNLYIAEFGVGPNYGGTYGRIRKMVIATGEVTTVADGFLDGPRDLATDGSHLYASEKGTLIRKISLATGEVTTLAGSGNYDSVDGVGTAASILYPEGLVCVDGALYFVESSKDRIRKVVFATGEVTTFAGSTGGFADGVGTEAQFAEPSGLATDGTNLYVSDRANAKIRRIVLATGVVSTLAGSIDGWADGTGASARFSRPQLLTCDGVHLYFPDSGRIRLIVLATGDVTTLAGSEYTGSTDGLGATASFNYPQGVAVDPLDPSRLFVADTHNNLIRLIRLNQ